MRHFKRMILKEGVTTEQFTDSVMYVAQFARGHLGWSGNARLFVDLGLDRMLHRQFNLNFKGNRRVRLKKMKRLLKQAFLKEVMQHVERLE